MVPEKGDSSQEKPEVVELATSKHQQSERPADEPDEAEKLADAEEPEQAAEPEAAKAEPEQAEKTDEAAEP